MDAWKKGLCALALAATAAGCIPTQRELRMEQDLDELKRRLAQTERGLVALRQDRTGETVERLEALARQQADFQAGLDTVRVEFQSFGGRLEDMARESAQMREDLSLVQDDLALKVTALEDRLATLETQTPLPEETPVPTSASEEDPASGYRMGLELIQQQGDYAGGRAQMERFLKDHPEHELAVNAMYWIGEAYYGEKQYESAILQFQDVIQRHGDHPKAAAALLKQGLAFHALGDLPNARTILQKVVAAYPKSEEAGKAKERLSAWERAD